MSVRRSDHLTGRFRRMIRTVLCGLASIALVAGVSLMATSPPAGARLAVDQPSGDGSEVEPRVLAELAEDETTDFWVYFRKTADLRPASAIANRAKQGRFVYDELTETARSSQAGVRAILEDDGAEYEPYWIANTIKVTGDEDLLRRIAARPEVEQITADRTYRIPEPIPAADDPPRINAVEWGVDRINAPQVWDEFGVRGEGIVVGNIDTGVHYTHEALVNQYRGNQGNGNFDHNYNWWDPSRVCGNPSLEPCDNDGHGTHTMGTMVGDDRAGNQVGVAPGARWIAAKGCEGVNCSQAALLSSGQFMLAPTDLEGNNPDPARRPHIVNNSWGGPADTDPWYQPTVQAWVAAGIFPQFSNGNTGPACGTSGNPGNLAESYAAGAFDIDDNLASFSSRGPSAFDSDLIKPNIAAPGVDIRSAWNDGSFNTISGTSMASPHVAGTVALMWSAANALERDVDTTRQLLDGSAIDTPDLTCGGTSENNNMYGEGRLDAFAAVEQSPRGPAGVIAGTVTDAGTGEPIAGARIAVAGGVDRDLFTGDDGTYSTRLPVGDYTITASAFGHADQSALAPIAADQTTIVDLALEPLPSVTLSGEVTDGSGHGWPMYAKVTAQGTPRSTFTDPVTGRYSLELPADSTHTLVVQSQYPGYATLSRTVDVGASDMTQDFELTVNDCETAPGYTSARVGVLGDFGGGLFDFLDSHGIPNDEFEWHIFADDDPADYDVIVVNDPSHPTRERFLQFLDETDAAGTGVVWLDNSAGSADSRSGIELLQEHLGNPSSRSSGSDSDIPYLYYKVTQNHPVLDGFEVGDEIVFDETSDFKSHAWFGGYEGEGRTVVANAGRADTGDLGPGIGVQQRGNSRHVLLSMHGDVGFFGSGPQHWTPDAAQVFLNALDWAATDASIECGPAPGGLVVGNVTDANTGAGVERATVTDTDNPSDSGTQSSTIGGDPAHGQGFFWRFSPQTGAKTFRASARNYAAATTTVDVRPDAVNEANLALPAGQLEMNPSALDAQREVGQGALQRSFTITNTGTAPATVELTERRGSFEVMGVERQPAPVRSVEGHFTPDAMPSGEQMAETPAQAAPSAAPWTTLPNYPQPIRDNSATVIEDVVYSFGGTNGRTSFADAYAFDPAVGRWEAITPMPEDRIKPEVVEHDGLIYILGGWSIDGRTNRSVFAYDPGSDIYRELTPMPAGRAAPGAAVVDGKIYVVGGCSAFQSCTQSNTVWRYDPRIDTWEALADYPDTVAWLGCAGLDGQLYCAGGARPDIFDSASASTYAFDPATNTWSERADLPYENWGMAYAAANGQLVVSGGVTDGSSEITNRGAAYDPAADRWTAIEPSNETVYRAPGVCGFYKIGGLDDLTTISNTEIHPDFRDCPVTGSLPWLSVAPQTVTLQPGEQAQATVQLDGSMDQPGTYHAGVGVRHDTPYGVDPVDVTVTATPPNDWGKVTGTVTSVDCQGNERPLPAAVVRINHAQGGVTRFSDAGGGYAYWIASSNNPVKLIVSSSGHIPQSRAVRVSPRKTAVEDFALRHTCGTGEVSVR